jgi:hypothetical protein
MTHCPMCGADCDSKETCPLCGCRVDISTPREKDAEYLAKDRWTFGEAAFDKPAEERKQKGDSSTKPGTARDPTQAMHIFREPTPRWVEEQSEAQTTTKAGIGRAPTMTISSSTETASEKAAKRFEEADPTAAGIGPPSTKAMNVFKKTPAEGEKKEATSSPLSTGPVGNGEQQENYVHIEPRTVSAKATAPLEIRMELPPSRVRSRPSHKAKRTGPDAEPKSSTGDRASLRGRGHPSKNDHKSGLMIGLVISSTILIAAWFVPDVLTANPLFSYELLGSAHGIDLISLLACPTLGAVLLALLIAPFRSISKAIVGLPVGIGALAIPLIYSEPPLPLQGEIILLTAIINIAVAVVIFTQTEYKVFGHVALVLVPGTLMGIAAIGIAIGKLPMAQLSAIKVPIKIYAAMLVSSLAASVIIESIRKKWKT